MSIKSPVMKGPFSWSFTSAVTFIPVPPLFWRVRGKDWLGVPGLMVPKSIEFGEAVREIAGMIFTLSDTVAEEHGPEGEVAFACWASSAPV